MGKGRNFKGEDQEMRQNEADELVLLELLLHGRKRAAWDRRRRENRKRRSEGRDQRAKQRRWSILWLESQRPKQKRRRILWRENQTAEDSVAKDRKEKLQVLRTEKSRRLGKKVMGELSEKVLGKFGGGILK